MVALGTSWNLTHLLTIFWWGGFALLFIKYSSLEYSAPSWPPNTAIGWKMASMFLKESCFSRPKQKRESLKSLHFVLPASRKILRLLLRRTWLPLQFGGASHTSQEACQQHK